MMEDLIQIGGVEGLPTDVADFHPDGAPLGPAGDIKYGAQSDRLAVHAVLSFSAGRDGTQHLWFHEGGPFLETALFGSCLDQWCWLKCFTASQAGLGKGDR
jgi:hypothetical protein